MKSANPFTFDPASIDDSGEARLQAVLRQAIGIDPVRPLTRPDIGGFVLLDEVSEIKSTQRTCLQKERDTLVSRSWPGELKTQAEAFYQTGKARLLVKFLSEHAPVWDARANPHLSFRSAAAALRLSGRVVGSGQCWWAGSDGVVPQRKPCAAPGPVAG